jgi:hypothetical protein
MNIRSNKPPHVVQEYLCYTRLLKALKLKTPHSEMFLILYALLNDTNIETNARREKFLRPRRTRVRRLKQKFRATKQPLNILSLRPSRSLASLLESELLTFNLTRVTFQESKFFESDFNILIFYNKSSS